MTTCRDLASKTWDFQHGDSANLDATVYTVTFSKKFTLKNIIFRKDMKLGFSFYSIIIAKYQ